MRNDFSNSVVTKCNFIGNLVESGGGGMENYSSSPTVTQCTFTGNTAKQGGGLYSTSTSHPSVINCMFLGNTASFGGAMYNVHTSSPMVINCTFHLNEAIGGGMYNRNASNPTLINCILHGDSPNEIFNETSTVTISYSNVQASGGSAAWDASIGTDGGGNIDADPLFANSLGADGIAGTSDDDLRLMSGSPCIDAGDYEAYLTSGGGLTDLDGKDRVIDNTNVVDTGVGAVTYLDMGAYEEGLCHDDGIFSLGDLASLEACVGGPGGALQLGCLCVDLDVDEHVDLRDFALFQLAFNP